MKIISPVRLLTIEPKRKLGFFCLYLYTFRYDMRIIAYEPRARKLGFFTYVLKIMLHA